MLVSRINNNYIILNLESIYVKSKHRPASRNRIGFGLESVGEDIFCSDKWTINANHCNINAHANNLALLMTVFCPWLCVHSTHALCKGPDQCAWTVQYKPQMTLPKLLWKLCRNYPTYLSLVLDASWPKHKKVKKLPQRQLCTHLLDSACDFTHVLWSARFWQL